MLSKRTVDVMATDSGKVVIETRIVKSVSTSSTTFADSTSSTSSNVNFFAGPRSSMSLQTVTGKVSDKSEANTHRGEGLSSSLSENMVSDSASATVDSSKKGDIGDIINNKVDNKVDVNEVKTKRDTVSKSSDGLPIEASQVVEDTLDEFGVSIAEVRRRMKRIEDEEAVILSRLYPINFMKVPTGDYITDSIFTHYSPQQVDVSLDGTERRIQYLKLQRDKASNTAIVIIKKFFEDFPETRIVDDILIRYMELLYENLTQSYLFDKRLYDKRMENYEKSSEFLAYKTALKEYYASAISLMDSLDIHKPKMPPPPEAPDPKLDVLLEIYDQILNNVQDERYIPHVLFAKAYVLGERYKDYKILKNLKDIDIDQKRQEAIAFLEQLLRKYPYNSYTVQAYLLIGEYLFNSIRKQPRRTIESIPYYQRAVQYIVERNVSKEYYEGVLYKLAWANFRVDEYREARTWFNYLMEDIEKNEELYSGRPMPSYVMVDAKEEILSNLAECFLKIQRKEDDTRSAAEEVASIYRTSVKFQIRRFIPTIYQKLGELYEESAEFEKVRDVYTTLLRKFPNFELAPYITNKIIRLLAIMAQNGEFEGEEQDMIEQQLYDERKNLFYRYGKTTQWYENIKLRIEAQQKGITLPFEDRSISPSGFNPRVLLIADSLGRNALFLNIVDGVTKAQLFDGSLKPPLGREIVIDKDKAAGFYRQAVGDIDNYLSVYSSYDSTSFFAAFQKAQILHFKLGKTMDAFRVYMKLVNNFAHDSLRSIMDDPDSPLKSYRKDALDLAYTIADNMTKQARVGFYTPGLDTISRIPINPQPIKREEMFLIEVLEAYGKFFPHDSIGIRSLNLLMKLYAVKGYMDKYKEVAAKSALYYPVQSVDVGILLMMAIREYDGKNYQSSELIAKGVFGAPFLKDDKTDKKQLEMRKYALNLVGTSIASMAKKYEEAKLFIDAAKEYERIVVEVPEWDQAALAAQLSANNYANAGFIKEAVQMNRRLINISKDQKQKLIGYSGLLYAYQKAGQLDSVALILEKISDDYLKDSASLAEKSLFDAIRICEQSSNFKQAIRISDKYIERYPGVEKTYQVVFNKINLSKKLGDTRGVFEAYGQFADTYKDNPLSVEAYFRRGDFSEERGDMDVAQDEYKKANERNQKLPLNKRNSLFASEALFRMSRKYLADYKGISVQIKVSDETFESNVNVDKKKKTKEGGDEVGISFDSKQKEEKYAEVKNSLLTQINLGGFRSVLALYRVGEISEDLASSYLNQVPLLTTYTNTSGLPIPPLKLSEALAKANIEASVMYMRSGEDYISVWKSLKKQLTEVSNKIEEESKEKQSNIVELKMSEKSYDQMQEAIKKITQNQEIFDKDVEFFEKQAVEWVMKTSSPVPHEILRDLVIAVLEAARKKGINSIYQSAVLKERNASMYANQRVPQEVKNFTYELGKGKNKISVFLGDVQELNVLSQIIASRTRPFTQQAVIAYDSVIKKLQVLDVGQNVISEAEGKILNLLMLPVEKMDSLVRVAGKYFDVFDRSYDDRLVKVDAAGKQSKKDVIDFVINKVKMNQIINVTNALTTATLDEYAAAYKTLKSIKSDEIKLNTVASKASKFVHDIGSLDLATYQRLKAKFKKYNDLANQFFDKDWFSSAAITYDPIQSLFLSLSQNVLGQAVILISEYKIQNEFTAKALRLLVESDRAKYLAFLGTEAIKEVTVQGNWTYSLFVSDDDAFEWYKKDFSKAGSWQSAIQNEEIEPLQYLVQKTDTSYTLKDINANSYWYKKYVPGATPILADTTKVDVALGVQNATPLSKEGDLYEVELEFDKKDGLSAKSNDEKLKTLGGLLQSNTDVVIEISPFIGDINVKNAKKKSDRIKKRIASIVKVVTNMGIDKKRLQSADEKNIDEGQQKTIFRVIKLVSSKDKSEKARRGKEDMGYIPESRTVSVLEFEKYGVLQRPQSSPFVYMRSSFEFKDAIKFAQIVLAKEASIDSIELYINDVFIDLEKERLVPAQGYSYDDKKQLIYDVTSKIINGKNLIAIKLPSNMSRSGLKLVTNLSYYGAVTQEQLQKLVNVVIENRAKSQKQIKEAGEHEVQAPNVPEE